MNSTSSRVHPLQFLDDGHSGEIIEIRKVFPDDSRYLATINRLDEMGVRIGKIVEMLNATGNSILIKVENSRIVIPRKIAMYILIRRA